MPEKIGKQMYVTDNSYCKRIGDNTSAKLNGKLVEILSDPYTQVIVLAIKSPHETVTHSFVNVSCKGLNYQVLEKSLSDIEPFH